MVQVENQMFMNFLNLQHLGEVDEEQQLKKEHFDIKAKEVLSSSNSATFNTVAAGAKILGMKPPPRKGTINDKVIPEIASYQQDHFDFKSDIRRLYLFPGKQEQITHVYPF